MDRGAKGKPGTDRARLYLSSISVLIGGELNAELERQAQMTKA